MTLPLRTLVLGGTRSGKSAFAEALVDGSHPVRYLATGRHDPTDADWVERIDAHRRRRPAQWTTVESPADLAQALSAGIDGATIVDDVGTWLTGALDDRQAWDLPRGTITPASDALVQAVAHCTTPVVLVSPEVGWGVVPATRSGRLFQDEMGTLNRKLATVCDSVVLVVAGLPLTLKTPSLNTPSLKTPTLHAPTTVPDTDGPS